MTSDWQLFSTEVVAGSEDFSFEPHVKGRTSSNQSDGTDIRKKTKRIGQCIFASTDHGETGRDTYLVRIILQFYLASFALAIPALDAFETEAHTFHVRLPYASLPLAAVL